MILKTSSAQVSEGRRNDLKKQTKLSTLFPTFFSSDSFIQFTAFFSTTKNTIEKSIIVATSLKIRNCLEEYSIMSFFL